MLGKISGRHMCLYLVIMLGKISGRHMCLYLVIMLGKVSGRHMCLYLVIYVGEDIWKAHVFVSSICWGVWQQSKTIMFISRQKLTLATS